MEREILERVGACEQYSRVDGSDVTTDGVQSVERGWAMIDKRAIDGLGQTACQ